MNATELQESINAARAELAHLNDDDKQARENLELLLNRMERQLEAPDESERLSGIDSLSEFVEQMEARHPRLTAIVNDIMNKLAGMGI
jgi:outer membrane protein TolC